MKTIMTILVLSICCLTGCSRPETENFGWFDFAPPQAWQKLEMNSDGTSIAFLPEKDVLNGKLEISNVDWMKTVEAGKLAEHIVNDLKLHWEHDKEQAETAGEPIPLFSCESVKPLLNITEAKIDAYRIRLIRNGHELHFLKHIVELDGHKYLVEFVAKEPKFSEHLPTVQKSISSLSFPNRESSSE